MSDGGHRVAGSGHYVEMAKTDQGAGNTARLISSYMNTTDKCLELYYWIRGGTAGDYSAADRARNLTGLSVVVVSEQLDETTVRSVGGSTVDFTRLFARLPSGIHRVVVEGRRDSSNLECAISLDDVAVMNCSRFGMFPILTRKTGGFPCTGILFLHLAATCKSLYTYLFTHHGRKRTTKRTKNVAGLPAQFRQVYTDATYFSLARAPRKLCTPPAEAGTACGALNTAIILHICCILHSNILQ